MGHSVTGITNVTDFSSRFIKGCIQLGLIPDWHGAINFVTVDYVTQALAHHCARTHWEGVSLLPRSTCSLERYGCLDQVLRLRDSAASYAEWREGVERSIDKALHPLLPTLPQAGFESELPIPEISAEGIVEFDCRNTLTALANTSIECPPLNSMLLNVPLVFGWKEILLCSHKIGNWLRRDWSVWSPNQILHSPSQRGT